ncbi:MAG: DUF177 domain-containing protein [Bacteroidota bacterium]
MSHSDKLYNIPFVGLKVGVHEYNYEVNSEFFEDLEYSLVQSGKLLVSLKLEKKETMLIAFFSVKGSVMADCDRCSTPMEIEIKGDFRVIYKFGLDEEDDESLVVIHPDAYQINIKDQIYELIIVSLPARKVHPKGECDEEMLKLVQQYTVNSEEEEEEDWNEDDEDWDDEDWDDEDLDDDSDEDDSTEDNPDDEDKPIDPRWSMLKNLN